MLQIEEVLNDFKKYSRLSDSQLVDVTFRNDKGETPLHYAAMFGDHLAIKLLCDAGVEVDARDEMGSTPLWHAVFNVQMTAVSALIASGANPELRNNIGESPWAMVEACENLQWMRPLLKPRSR